MVYYFVFILYLSVRLSFCLYVYCVYDLHNNNNNNTKFSCDRSLVVGCRWWNDRHPDRQADKHPGMTIRLTLAAANVTQQTPTDNKGRLELSGAREPILR